MSANAEPPTTGPQRVRNGDSRSTPPRRLRLFIALELPAAWHNALAGLERRLERAAPGFGRWVDPSLFHLTLVFLGDQDESSVVEIERALQAGTDAARPFELSPGALGSLGRGRDLSVVWASVEAHPPAALTALHTRLVAALDQSGMSYAGTPFSPHVTLARARRDANREQHGAMGRALVNTIWHPAPEPFVCREAFLMHSDTRPTGPVYTPIARVPLSASD